MILMARQMSQNGALSATSKVALLSFLIALLVTSSAMSERLAEVLGLHLNFPVVPITIVLVCLYLLYLSLGYRLYSHWWTASKRIPFTLVWILLYTVLVCAFIFIYPYADSGALGFYSDREEAIDIGVNAILEGRYPYACHAQSGVHAGCPQSGNPLAPMPGAFLLAAPVIMLLGSAAWLSLISLGLAYLGLLWLWKNYQMPAQCMIFLVALSPVISAEILTGGDHLANAMFVSLPLLLLIQNPHRPVAPLLALLFGIALSWRGLFWLLLVPLFFYLLRHKQWRVLVYHGVLTALGFGLVTLPFLIWNVDEFTPLAVQQRYQLYEHIIPHASILMPTVIILLGSYLGWRAKDNQQLILACGWMLLLPILIAVCLNSFESGRLSTTFYGWYAITSLPLLGVATIGVFTKDPNGQSVAARSGSVSPNGSATIEDDLGSGEQTSRLPHTWPETRFQSPG